MTHQLAALMGEQRNLVQLSLAQAVSQQLRQGRCAHGHACQCVGFKLKVLGQSPAQLRAPVSLFYENKRNANCCCRHNSISTSGTSRHWAGGHWAGGRTQAARAPL